MQINSINNTISFSKRHKKKHIVRNIPSSNVNPQPATLPPAPPGVNMEVLNVRPRTKEEILAEKLERVQGSNVEIHKASDFYVKRAQELQREAQERLITANQIREKAKILHIPRINYGDTSFDIKSIGNKRYFESPRTILSFNWQPQQCYEIDKKTGKLIQYRRDKSKQEQGSETVFNFKNGNLVSCEVGQRGNFAAERYNFSDGILKSVELFVKGDDKNYTATRKFDYYYGGILKSYHRDYSKEGKNERAQYAYFYNSLEQAPLGFASTWQKQEEDLWSAKEYMVVLPDNSANYFVDFYKDGPVITKNELHFIPSKD